MKTHVIQLEPHDDLVSIRDKMSWAKTPRILLVWSLRRRRARLSEIDLTVLNRHAVSLGARLGLVTRQTGLRRMAERAQIPVFRTTSEAQRVEWPAPLRLPPNSQNLGGEKRGGHLRGLRDHRIELGALRPKDRGGFPGPVGRVGFFSLGVLSVLLLALLFVPSAEIQLQPISETQSLTLPVSASPEARSVSLSGTIPTYTRTLSASGSDSIPASGRLLLPDAVARGTATLTNLTEDPISVPRGTVLIAEGETPLRFVTDRAVEVEAGAGSTADAPVRALQAGARGNLPAETPLAFESALGLSLTAANPAPLTGGSDRSQPAPTEVDRTRLYARLSAALLEQALARALASPDVVFADTVSAAEATAESYSPPAGEAGANLSLDLAQEFQVQYASRTDLETLARAALDASLRPGYEAASSAITLIPLSEPVTGSDGVTRWELRAERRVQAAIRPDEVIEQVRGRTVPSAQAALGALLLQRTAEIRLAPAWFPLLPLIPLRISVDAGS
jgi:hypothetical protein